MAMRMREYAVHANYAVQADYAHICKYVIVIDQILVSGCGINQEWLDLYRESDNYNSFHQR